MTIQEPLIAPFLNGLFSFAHLLPCNAYVKITRQNNLRNVYVFTRGCLRVMTSFFACNEECGEVIGDKFNAEFSWEI